MGTVIRSVAAVPDKAPSTVKKIKWSMAFFIRRGVPL
jgi:hypothetical protein